MKASPLAGRANAAAITPGKGCTRKKGTNTMHNQRRRSETAVLRSLMLLAPGAVAPAPSVEGWDEMQGYPDGGAYGYPGYDTVGVNWGNVANTVFNPIEHMKMLGRVMQGNNPFGGGPAPAPAARPQLPPPPTLPNGAYQALQGGPRRLLSYMGLGSHVFLPGAATSFQFEAEPQAAFRGRRLVISQAKSDGAAGILVTVSEPLTVSGMPQTPAPSQDAPVEMFSSDTTYSMLDLQIATSATKITLGLSVSAAPATGETVSVAAGLYGEWLR